MSVYSRVFCVVPHSSIKDSIASQRFATPRDFAVNSMTLRN